MKDKITDEFKEIFSQTKKWITLEIRYAKLTAAEKCTILMGAIALALISLLIGMVILILLAWSLVDFLREFMSPSLACLSVSGVLVLVIILIVVLRNPLVINPISRFLTKLFIEK